MERLSCSGCRYNWAGRCQDRSIYGPEAGDLLVDPGPRLCHEAPQTLSESLVVYLREHEGVKA